MSFKGLFIALLAVGVAAAGFWGGRELERRRTAFEAEQVAQAHRAELAALKAAAVSWADAVAKGQGEAVLRAFTSGISPSILADRRESLEISAVSLLRIPGTEGVHILRPDGTVLYSSNAKLTTTGELGEVGAWALAATELVSRPGARPGTLDYAVPLIDSGRVLATVWMRYGQAAVRDATRPPSLNVAGEQSSTPNSAATKADP